jgi:hypothetical protein
MFLLDLNVRWQIVQQWRGKGNKATVEMTSGRQSLSLFSKCHNNATKIPAETDQITLQATQEHVLVEVVELCAKNCITLTVHEGSPMHIVVNRISLYVGHKQYKTIMMTLTMVLFCGGANRSGESRSGSKYNPSFFVTIL